MYNSDTIKKFIVYISLYLFMIWIIISVSMFEVKHTYDFPILRGIIVAFATILLTKYFLYMLVSPWYDVATSYRKKIHKKEVEQYHPLVSVMVPAWNEACGILATIETILKSTYRNIEIIIINDGSTDYSDTLIREFLEKYYRQGSEQKDIQIIYRYQKNRGKGSALNSAVKSSHGQILISIDADCIVLPDTIKNFVFYFSDPKVMAAVGNVKIGNTQKIIGVVQYLEYLFSFYFKKAESMMNVIYIIGGAAGAFRKEVFEKIGTYNINNITEDIDLSIRIQDAGMKIIYAEKAIVYTEGASDIGGLRKQRLRWKQGRFETFKNHKHLFFSMQKKHNKVLAWLVLPLAIFGELQISLELFFILFLYLYAFITNDFSSFISGIVVVASMFFIQRFFDDKEHKSFSFYALAPIGWLLFYLSTFVEWNAIFGSIKSAVHNQKPTWQHWERKGIAKNIKFLPGSKKSYL